MRDADEPALLADGRDRLGGREASWHGALDEHRDQVALTAPHLLADEHGQPGGLLTGHITRLERAGDRLVVGDREVG
jgi:hypothetical protein